MNDDKDEINLRPLDTLLKAMKQKTVVAKIGVLGSNNARSGSGTSSNATIGAAHEFGTSRLPQRSFLRMPLADVFPKNLEKQGVFNEFALKEVMRTGSFNILVERAAILAVATVLEAFDTSGFGTWTALKDKTLDKKKTKQILIETGQLRDSISYEIK